MEGKKENEPDRVGDNNRQVSNRIHNLKWTKWNENAGCKTSIKI